MVWPTPQQVLGFFYFPDNPRAAEGMTGKRRTPWEPPPQPSTFPLCLQLNHTELNLVVRDRMMKSTQVTCRCLHLASTVADISAKSFEVMISFQISLPFKNSFSFFQAYLPICSEPRALSLPFPQVGFLGSGQCCRLPSQPSIRQQPLPSLTVQRSHRHQFAH